MLCWAFACPLPLSSLVHVSPIGLLPKSNQPGSWRMIVDLSHLRRSSVNDAIPPSLCSPQYPSIDDAVAVILALDCHTQLVKIDLRKAYRVLPIHPWDFLGVSWRISCCRPLAAVSPEDFYSFLRCSGVGDTVCWRSFPFALFGISLAAQL